MEFLLLIGFLVLLGFYSTLSERVRKLEKSIEDKPVIASEVIKPRPIPPVPQKIENNDWLQTSETDMGVSLNSSLPAWQVQKSQPLTISETEEFFLVTWFKDQPLIKIGAIIFFLGAVWFVAYAIDNNWISPLTRIALGVLLALAIYVVGHLRRTIVAQYLTMTVLGTGVLMGTVIASQFVFINPVVPAGLAFASMFFSLVYTLYVGLQAKAEWLAITTAIAGLCIPYLVVTASPQPILLLIYLLLLSGTLLTVVFNTSWRSLTSVLIVGVSIHLFAVQMSLVLKDFALWLFVIIFAALFFVGVTTTVYQFGRPKLLDLVNLALVTLVFVHFADQLAYSPALALFIASLLTAFVAYFFRQADADADTVSLYAAISTILLLIATAFLFDGYVLTIAFALEALILFLLSLRLATVERTIYISSSIFLLPLFTGLSDLSSPAWQSGIIHPEALGTVAVILSLGTAILVILREKVLLDIDWLRSILAMLIIAWYGFAIFTAPALAKGLGHIFDGLVTVSVFLTLVSMILILSVLRYLNRSDWFTLVVIAWFVPTIIALVLLSLPAWNISIWQPALFASLLYAGTTLSLLLTYWRLTQSAVGESRIILGNVTYGLVWTLLVYGMSLIYTLADALFSSDIKRVLTAVGITVLIYFTSNCLMWFKASANRLLPILLSLIVPLLFYIDSLDFNGWIDGVLGIDAIGLYIFVTILALLGISVRNYSKIFSGYAKDLMTKASALLLAFSGFTAFLLVWMISHTVFGATAVAVTIALFLYTVVGLVCYVYGRSNDSKTTKQIGILLLTTVVIRLGLVDVWGMETVWRIFTFLGIGLLFIAAALLERIEKVK